jgi:hypothetical protein
MLHLEYSKCLNMVFVAFTHGMALPVLFPIAALGVFNQYVCQRMQFAYFFKQPPLMDNNLNDNSLAILQIAPLFMCLIGFWQISNRQIFFNQASEINFAKEVAHPQHGFFDWDEGVTYTLFIVSFIPIFIFFRTYSHIIFKMGELVRFFVNLKGIDRDWNITMSFDEDLGTYWECLPGMKQKRWFTQETRMRARLNMGNVSESSLENLRTAKRGNNMISNVHNYDILQNPWYANAFSYQWMERRTEHESNDMVSRLIYMGE